MRPIFLSLVFSVLPLASVACGSNDADPQSVEPSPSCPAGNTLGGAFGDACDTAADCSSGSSQAYCVFDESQGCSAKGRCFVTCGAIPGGAEELIGCACDGSSVMDPLAVPAGYAPQPLGSVPGAGGVCAADAGVQ